MLFRLLLISLGVSADAFAVSIGKGMSVRNVKVRHHWLVGIWFGGFQALFPILGYYTASFFQDYVAAVDHWIIFGLLFLIGANMIREAVYGKEDDPQGQAAGRPTGVATQADLSQGGSACENGSECIGPAAGPRSETPDSPFSWKKMLPLSIATSIDAFGVGASLGLMGTNIWLAASVIGVVTALASMLGLRIGNVFGSRWRRPAQIAGGILLIALGTQILLDHLGLIPDIL